jgi:uracil-DNA glycosylase
LSRLDRPLAALLDDDHGDWQPLLNNWRASVAGRQLMQAVDARVASGAVVYPVDVFRALRLTPMARTQVLILGQDPYHGPGQAEGLAFSVPAGQRVPPSLRNIFKELQRDLGLSIPTQGSLMAWARQGVLLLNTSLTVEDGLPGSHAKLGWQTLTDDICLSLAQASSPKVFFLWGAHAQAKASLLVGAGQHLVLQANHPSPLSALRPPVPFIGCGHFGLSNQFLTNAGRDVVDWRLG